MPKIITPLTAAQVKNAKPKDRLYKLADGGGLALWVKPNGSKVWRFSFNGENGKPQTLTLGAYPLFSLVQAREWRDEQKRKLALGQNIKRVKVRTAYTLEKIAREWHGKWRKDMAEKYTVQVMRNFERYIFPVIGNRDIRQIKTIDVVECLRIMERRGIADSLRKTKNSLNLVFSYAVGSGLIEYNPVLQIGKQVFEKPKNRHMAALPPFRASTPDRFFRAAQRVCQSDQPPENHADDTACYLLAAADYDARTRNRTGTMGRNR